MRRKLYKEAQQVAFGAGTNLSQNGNEEDTNPIDTDEEPNPDENKPALTVDDVDGMDEADVLDKVYFNIPDNIGDDVRQKLFDRANQIRLNRENGTLNGKNMSDMAKNVISNAQNFLKNQKQFKG